MSTSIEWLCDPIGEPSIWRRVWFRRNEYWNELDSFRDRTGSYPDWTFDFISVHQNDGLFGPFTLWSPLCLVDDMTAKRPAFEGKQFNERFEAVCYALRVCRVIERRTGKRLHVVCCDDAKKFLSNSDQRFQCAYEK